MKKVLSLVLCLILALSMFAIVPMTASAAEEELSPTGATSGKTGNCTWSLDGTVLTISGNGSMGHYGASFGAAPWGTAITRVVIKNGVTNIGNFAFINCEKLSSVVIPGSVTKIGMSAFAGCKSIKSFTIPDTVTEVRASAFSGCSGLENLTIGSSVTSDLYGMFDGCSSLKSITVSANNKFFDSRDNSNAIIQTKTNSLVLGCKNTVIPNSVTDIGNFAFYGCSNLVSINIPDSVTSIASGAFNGCSGLSSITVSSGNPVFDSRDNCNAIIKTKTNSLVLGCKDTVVPDSVTQIDQEAFIGNTGITGITIPDSVTSIGEDAFSGCENLENITVPDSVKSIGGDAFSDTPWYDNQPDGLVYAGKVAYEYKGTCPADLEIKEGTVAIADKAFFGCDNLVSVTIPDSVVRIGGGAFEYCDNLENITIPDSVTSIGSGAFYNTPWYDNQPDDLVYAGKVAFRFKNPWDYYSASVEIDEGTLGIADEAFSYCSDLEEGIIPDSVVRIGAYAFSECPSLRSVTIPASVTSIGNYAFGYSFDYDNDDMIKADDFSICGYNGTAAEQYANDNGFTFISLGDKPSGMILGDADNDGEVTILDATVIQRHIAELSTESYNEAAADADQDGMVTIMDATSIQRHIAELPTNENIGNPI